MRFICKQTVYWQVDERLVLKKIEMMIDFVKYVSYEGVTKFQAVCLCCFFSTLYVGSLYIKSQNLPRDNPKTIKERIIRATIASVLICYILYAFSKYSTHNVSPSATFLHWIGIRSEGIIPAILLPSLLVLILFLGPIVMLIIDNAYLSLKYYSISDIVLWRNYFVAPLSEELVFRGCMMPLLLPSMGHFHAILIGPWFFGIAHFHHAYEQYKARIHSVSNILISTLFQASYTTVFGILSSLIFLRTGHLTSAFLSHSLCNLMGFPEFEQALSHRHKYLVCSCFVIGLVLFLFLFNPLTNPVLYSNELYVNFN